MLPQRQGQPLPHHANTASSSHRRWRIACLLGIGVLVNFFDRVNLSVSHAALIGSFGISDITFGYLAGAYSWTYALCQVPVGVLLDRFGVRRIGRLSTLVWSVASFAAALSPTLGGLFAARLLLGIGEAPTFPANAKAVGLWFPPRERSFATAISDAAAKFASALGIPVLGFLLLRLGWRWSFAFTGLLSLGYFVLFVLVYRDPADDPHLTTTERSLIAGHRVLASDPEPEPPAASIGYLLRQPAVIGLSLGFGSYNYIFFLLLTWLPTYLSVALGVNLLDSFLYTGVPWLVATVTDLAGGFASDYLITRGWNADRVRKTILVVGTACGLGILGAVHAHSAGRALVWISISIGGLAAAAPVAWSLPSLIAPRGSVASVGGIVNLTSQISGIAAPIATGYLLTATHNYAWAFGVAAAYLLVGIAAYALLLGPIRELPPEPAG